MALVKACYNMQYLAYYVVFNISGDICDGSIYHVP